MMRFSFVFLFVTMSLLSAAEAAAAEVECGISGANVTERIVGGEEATPHTWPRQVLVDCSNGTYGGTCGGSLVADQWVITAAHCLSLAKVDKFKCEVFLGKHYSSTANEVEPGQVIIGIEKYFVHEEYKPFPTVNDIALLKLNKTVQYDKNVKPICLPFDLPELKNTSTCYATGWGYDDRKKEKLAETLKQLKMPIHDDYGYCKFAPYAIEQKICAGSWDRQDDACKGDSGGPLACFEDGKWYLRGVASFVAAHSRDDICYSVASFTKVTAFRDWITKKIEGN